VTNLHRDRKMKRNSKRVSQASKDRRNRVFVCCSFRIELGFGDLSAEFKFGDLAARFDRGEVLAGSRGEDSLQRLM